MKARHDFKTDKEYQMYLKIYYAGLATRGLLLNNDFQDEMTLVKTAVDIADLMVAQLFHKEQLSVSEKEKPPLMELKEAEKRNNKRKEIGLLLSSAEILYNQKAYKSALTQFEKALTLDVANKKIITSIELCKKWIKAVDGLNDLEQEKQFVKPKTGELIDFTDEKSKEEFTTSFPPLD